MKTYRCTQCPAFLELPDKLALNPSASPCPNCLRKGTLVKYETPNYANLRKHCLGLSSRIDKLERALDQLDTVTRVQAAAIDELQDLFNEVAEELELGEFERQPH